jgi:hypothetical protein
MTRAILKSGIAAEIPTDGDLTLSDRAMPPRAFLWANDRPHQGVMKMKWCWWHFKLCVSKLPNGQCIKWVWICIPRIIWVDRVWPPEPPEWLELEGLRQEVIHDIQILAAIDELAERLTDRMKTNVRAIVREQARSAALPEGMELGFSDSGKSAT